MSKGMVLLRSLLILCLLIISSCAKNEGSLSLIANKKFVEENTGLFKNQKEIRYEDCLKLVTIIPISLPSIARKDDVSKIVEKSLEYAHKRGIEGNIIINAKIKESMLLLPPLYGSYCIILEGIVATLDEEGFKKVIDSHNAE
jgi:hypothetical protein